MAVGLKGVALVRDVQGLQLAKAVVADGPSARGWLCGFWSAGWLVSLPRFAAVRKMVRMLGARGRAVGLL